MVQTFIEKRSHGPARATRPEAAQSVPISAASWKPVCCRSVPFPVERRPASVPRADRAAKATRVSSGRVQFTTGSPGKEYLCRSWCSIALHECLKAGRGCTIPLSCAGRACNFGLRQGVAVAMSVEWHNVMAALQRPVLLVWRLGVLSCSGRERLGSPVRGFLRTMNILVSFAAILIISIGYAVPVARGAESSSRPSAKQGKQPAATSKGDVATRMEQGIIRFTNEMRRSHDLDPLTSTEALKFLATTQSGLLCKYGVLEHESEKFPPQWRRFTSRMRLISIRSGAENIAYRTIDRDPLVWARDIVNGWMKSPHHRKNILDARFSYMGVGVKLCKNNIAYVAQVFSTDRGRVPQERR